MKEPKRADVIQVAGLVQSVSMVDEDGLIHEVSIEDYMDLMGCDDEEYVQDAIDAAYELLVDEGKVVERKEGYYLVEAMEEWDKKLAADRRELEQQRIDEMQSYDFSVWRS